MIIKPIAKLNEVNICEGVPIQLVVNGTNGEVMNNTQGMIEMGLISDNDLEKEEEGPILYGNYHDYSEPLFNNHTQPEQNANNNQPIEVQWLSFSEKLKALQTVMEVYKDQEKAEIQNKRVDMTCLAKDIYLSFQNKLSPSLHRESSAIAYFNESISSTYKELPLKNSAKRRASFGDRPINSGTTISVLTDDSRVQSEPTKTRNLQSN